MQNTEGGLYASAGTATVSNSNIYYNVFNVRQDTDGTNTATIDLSGGTSKTTNTVFCTSRGESRWYSDWYYDSSYYNLLPSTSVVNTTSATMNASNVAWETAGPDQFSCDSALDSCTCEINACTNASADGDMDAVYTGTGTITTTGNSVTTANCTQPSLCGATASCAQAYGSTQYVCCQYPGTSDPGFKFCRVLSRTRPGGFCYYQC